MIKPLLFKHSDKKLLAFVSPQLTVVTLNSPSSSFEATLIPVAVNAIHLSVNFFAPIYPQRSKTIILAFPARAVHYSVVDCDLDIFPVE